MALRRDYSVFQMWDLAKVEDLTLSSISLVPTLKLYTATMMK